MGLLTPEIRAMIGTERRYTAPEEIGRAAMRYFGLAVGDDNPLYTDEHYARANGYPGVIAPPTMLCETNQYAGLRRDENGYAGHVWHLDIPNTTLVRGGNSYVFHQPVLATDVITAVWRIADITERTNSRGRDMVILTSIAQYATADGKPLVTNTESLIWVERGAES
jgi:acyl dehydratase